jgi:hypothetical protein
VFWSPNDVISVVVGTNKTGTPFTSTNTSPEPVASFKGTMPFGSGAIWAVYPNYPGAYFDGTYLVTNLSELQTGVAGTFDDDLFVSVAYSSSTSLTFYHVVGGFKFTLTQPGIKKITLISNGGEPLAGEMGIVNRDGRPTFWATGDTSSEIRLYPEADPYEVNTFEVGKDYYFVTMPIELENGFSLIFEKVDGSIASRVVNKPVEIEAAHFKTLENVDKGLEFEKDFFSYTPSSVSLSSKGGMFTVNVHTSKDFHFDIGSDWIQEVVHEGNPLIEATYTFKASGNTGKARDGYIMVCDDKNCYVINVHQDAGSEDDWKTAGFVHHSLGMRFTATWCGYCPIMSESFRLAKLNLKDRFEYACFYSSSSGGNYGFSGINILANQYLVDGYPTGIVDGRREIGNYVSEYASALIAAVVDETEANYPTATAIGLKSTLSGQLVTVKVDVYAHYADSYKLTVLLLENGIVGYQRDFYDGDHTDFVHNKVVREAFTNVSGTAFSTTSAVEKKSFSYSLTIPKDYDTSNLEILAYVQRPFGSQTVLQSGDYGSYYVDNCCAAPLGSTWAPDLK